MSTLSEQSSTDSTTTTTTVDQQQQQQQASQEDDEIALLAQTRRNQRSRERRVPNTRAPPSVTMATISNVFPDELRNTFLKAGYADMQGRRPTMEDACIVNVHYRTSSVYTQYPHLSQLSESFVGVYDGHGGTDASKYVGTNLHEIFKSKLELLDEFLIKRNKLIQNNGSGNSSDDASSIVDDTTSVDELYHLNDCMVHRLRKYLKIAPVHKSDDSDDSDDEDDEDDDEDDETADETSIESISLESMVEEQIIPQLLRETFLETNDKVCYDEKIKNGTTASVAYIRPVVRTSLEATSKVTHRLFTANVGDSRIVLCRSGKAQRLTIDHRPNDPDEQRRVKDAGGYIINHRVNAILAVTRAIGDVYLQPMVSPDPYTAAVNLLAEDEFIIVACDGVWDVIEDQVAVDLIKDETDPRVASCKLRDEAYSRGSTDNISVAVIRIRKEETD